MIEGYNTDGHRVMLNPLEVVEVYAGGHDDYSWWCNVVTTNRTTHRFKGTTARQVWEQLGRADLYQTAKEITS